MRFSYFIARIQRCKFSVLVHRSVDTKLLYYVTEIECVHHVCSCCCCSILPIWQVSIFTDAILICLVATSLVHHNWYCLPPSSITNPKTLFLVFHNLCFLVLVLLTLSSVMSHVWGWSISTIFSAPWFISLVLPIPVKNWFKKNLTIKKDVDTCRTPPTHHHMKQFWLIL